MDTSSSVRVALVGLGFGAEFVPIYLNHPSVADVAICDPDPAVLAAVADTYGVDRRYTQLEHVLADNSVDAVHLVTPIPHHARHTLAVLEAGKHCACTVPMATSLDDLFAIVAAQRESGKQYMMMETAVYTREFLMVKQMLDEGHLGRIQFLRGAHYQDMENWPDYWLGLPPMHYATHAVAPLLALAKRRVLRVHCFGSGTMRPELQKRYGNPYPIETAIFQFEESALAAEVTRSLFHTARAYSESFNVYAEDVSFEWQQIEAEEPVLFRMEPLRQGRGRPITAERVTAPDYADRLPEAIRRFTRRGVYDNTKTHRSFQQGGGHGGSHPHLVHEFIDSIVTGRPPRINAVRAANWTAAGICAHQSAMQNGEQVLIPYFSEES